MNTNPNLFIPGFAKCGTSYLHDILDSHDEISMSKIKETHNFVLEKNYKKITNSNFDFNFNYMFKNQMSKYNGESSTLNIMDSKFIKRIYHHCENPKFIIILRDPIERIISHFNWMSYLGNVKLSFKDEIMNNMDKQFDPNKDFNGNYKNYILFSKYYENILNLKRYFPNSYIVINLEMLTSDFSNTIEYVCSFLKIANSFKDIQIINSKINETPKIIISKKPYMISLLSKFIGNKSKKFLKKFYFIKSNIEKFKRSEYIYKPSINEEFFLFKILENDIIGFKNEFPRLVSKWKTTNRYLEFK